MKRFLNLLLGFVLLAGNASAVEIIAPTGPIKPGQIVRMRVTNIAPEQYRGMVFDYSPKTDVFADISRDVLSDDLIIYFQAMIPGKHRLSLSQNLWVKDAQPLLESATQAKIDPLLLAKLKADIAAIQTKYPYTEDIAEIVVSGEVPKPVPDPDKPPPYDPNKVTQVTYVYEEDNTVTPGPVALGLQKLNAGGLIKATEFEEDSLNGLGQVPKQYVIALEAARKAGLPALVFQAGDKVTKVVPNPKLESDVVRMERVR